MRIAKTVVSESLFVFFFLITCMHGYSQLASPDPSVCLTKVFSKSYQYSSAGFVHSFFELPDHSLITGGPMNGNYFLMKSDDSGNTVWCKKYTAIQTDQSRSLLDLNDQIISGFTEGVATTLVYMDTAGIPQSAYSIKTAFSPLSFVDLAITGNGDKIVLMKEQNASFDGHILLRLSQDLSRVIWSKSFSSYIFNSYYSLGAGRLLIDSNKILLPTDLGLICFDAATGDLVFRRYYKVNNNDAHLNTIYRYDSGYVMKAFLYDIQAWGIIRLDTAFHIMNSYRFTNVNYNYPLQMFVEDDGSFYAAYDYSMANIMFVNSKDSVQWSHASVAIPLARPVSLIGTDQSLYTVGVSNYNYPVGGSGFFGYLGIVKTDYNGRTNACTSFDNSIGTTPTTALVQLSQIIIPNSSPVSISAASIVSSSFSFNENYTCTAVSNCSSVKIRGASSLCGQNKARFTGVKNAGCYLPVRWNISGGNSSLQQVNDSTSEIEFRESGTYRVVALLGGACIPITDTQYVQVTITDYREVDLGADTSLCPGNSILLNAHKGFTSYLWQDASTDSMLTARQPGKYFVETTDACGNRFSDTVIISAHAPIPFDLGPDRTKCNNDTLHLSAPPGFLNYSWANNYNISSVISQNVIVNPLTDTSYYIMAEKTPGCFAYDTVKVHVSVSPKINLGIDKSFCSGDSAAFDAGSGFTAYQWSNGSTQQQIIAKNSGTYSVVGITNEGCRSYDTVTVVNVFANPVVKLDHSSALCTGTTRILDAGYFASYLWNDGSTSKQTTVNAVGIYAVQVTDNNGCRGKDTTTITTILPLPSGFLPADTLVCSYDPLKVTTLGSYRLYQWSTEATSSSIIITRPGNYWLEVKDANGCTGRDSISVGLKECMKGIYVPTAFSPNKDAKNDVFRPLLFGNVKKYKFTVYNRWGQIVFQTAELNKGWDGTVAGLLQDSNVFVWICTYQLEGEETKIKKGTVILIR